MLASSRDGEPAGGDPAKLSLANVVALAPLLPLNTAFQLLTKPLLDRGLGLRLKRARLCCAFHPVVEAPSSLVVGYGLPGCVCFSKLHTQLTCGACGTSSHSC